MLKVFESFSGIGSTRMALRNIGIEFEVVGTSEVDKYAILCYDLIHCNDTDVPVKTKQEMLRVMKQANIGYNFSTGANELPKDEESIKKLYDAHIRSHNYGDIRLIDETLLPDFDLFTYSFPCKNISIAGQQMGLQEGSGTQSSLLWECTKIIKHKKPKYLLMENVKNLVSGKHIKNFKLWIDLLDKLGYNSYWRVLNGLNYGVPQNRERVIMVSILKTEDSGFNMPLQSKLEAKTMLDIIEDEVDDRYFEPSLYIETYSNNTNGIITHKANVEVTVRKYDVDKEALRQMLCKHLKDSIYTKRTLSEEIGLPYTLVEHWFRGSVKSFSIPLAEYWYRLKELINIETDEYDLAVTTFITRRGVFDKAQRVYDVRGIAPTLTASSCNEKILLENGRIRHLTPRETWRLMGYSDIDFDKVSHIVESRLYERAGRGIVVPMLEEVFKELFKE